MVTRIWFGETIPGMNGKDGLIRENFHEAKKRKTKYLLEILSQSRNKHKGSVKVEFTRYTCRLLDWDNHCASFKHIGDALTKAGVIIDDNPFVIREFIPKQVRVHSRKEIGCEILITDYVTTNNHSKLESTMD